VESVRRRLATSATSNVYTNYSSLHRFFLKAFPFGAGRTVVPLATCATPSQAGLGGLQAEAQFIVPAKVGRCYELPD